MVELSISGGELNKGTGSFLSSADVVLKMDGGDLYDDKKVRKRNRVGTWDDEYLYDGGFARKRNRVGTWDDEYLYEGDFARKRNRVATWDDEYLYDGDFARKRNRLMEVQDATETEIKVLGLAYLSLL
jgi:hypothetical protein